MDKKKLNFANDSVNYKPGMSAQQVNNMNMNMIDFPELSLENISKSGKSVSSTTTSVVDEDVTTEEPKKFVPKIKRHPCKKILNGEECPYNTRCVFAHCINEIKPEECSFENCYNVYINKKGLYYNNSGPKICQRIHNGETIQNYHRRLKTTEKYPGFPEDIPKISMKCTKMCRSVYSESGKCETENCQFAHTDDELVILPCGFKEKCFNVRFVDNLYVNSTKGGKICNRIHPGESKTNVRLRLNEKF